VSRKSERLINLTIALLATKRFITKSELFKTVEGYEGSAESKERMFERDKDDLRSLGIEIEVGSFDPLFNDEAGYRIKQENYQLDLGEVTALDSGGKSLARGLSR
jgi:proteasome accessory factor B